MAGNRSNGRLNAASAMRTYLWPESGRMWPNQHSQPEVQVWAGAYQQMPAACVVSQMACSTHLEGAHTIKGTDVIKSRGTMRPPGLLYAHFSAADWVPVLSCMMLVIRMMGQCRTCCCKQLMGISNRKTRQTVTCLWQNLVVHGKPSWAPGYQPVHDFPLAKRASGESVTGTGPIQMGQIPPWHPISHSQSHRGEFMRARQT